jgi:PAS domain-containing protein
LALDQWHIIGLVIFSTIAFLLVVVLLIQRSRHGRAKDSLRSSEERYFLALAGSTDGLWDWDILSDTAFYFDRFDNSYREVRFCYSERNFGNKLQR